MIRYLLLLMFFFVSGFNPAYPQQEQKEDLEEYSLQKTIDGLTKQSKNISGLSFSKADGVSEERKLILNQFKAEINSNTASLIKKLCLHQDVSTEVAFYNDPKTSNATEYLLSYKANLKLIQSVFFKGKGFSQSIGTIESPAVDIQPFRSSSKIYDAITKEIYKALLEDLNSADPGAWNQTKFILTFGNSENFRQYIDKRCADIDQLNNSVTENIRNLGHNLSSNTSVLEDLYLMITGKDPVNSTAEGETQVSNAAYISSQYLASTYLFGLEVIKHNQLLYAPPVSDMFANTYDYDKLKIKPFTSSELQYIPSPQAPDALRVEAIKLETSYKEQPAPVEIPEISFTEKYSLSSIQKTVTELNGKKDANYFTPYMKLLSTTEAVVGDYATESLKLSKNAQDEAYLVAEEAKSFSAGCEFVLAAASFITTAGIGTVAIGTMIGIGALDETKMISKEIEEYVPAGSIVKNHAASVGLYLWMVATRVPSVSIALSKTPLLRLGISSYFAYDLGTSLIEIEKQKRAITDAVALGQMTEAEAKLKELDLLKSTITTATFFAHTIKGLPAEIKASDELIKQTILPKVKGYIDLLSNIGSQQELVLIQLSDGRAVPIEKKVKFVLDEYNKSFCETSKNVDKGSDNKATNLESSDNIKNSVEEKFKKENTPNVDNMLKEENLDNTDNTVEDIAPMLRKTKQITTIKDIKRLLIITAMDVEERAITKDYKFSEAYVDKDLGVSVKWLKIGRRKIFVANSGLGTVNAALTTAILSRKLKIDAILLLGVGGALHTSLDVGDVVVADKVIQHDSFISSDDGSQLMAPGALFLSVSAEERQSPVMFSNPVLVDWLKSRLSTLYPAGTYSGTLLSGNEFVGSAERKREIASIEENVYMVDMESAGIAQIAQKLNIPFVAAKTVADRMSQNGTISNDYKKFLQSASNHAAEIFKIVVLEFGAK